MNNLGIPLRVESQSLEKFTSANVKTPENVEQVKKLSQEFEAVFTEIVLKSMRSTVGKDNLIDGGSGEQVFQSMLDSEYAKILASQSQSGLASSIQEHLLSLMGDTGSGSRIGSRVGISEYKKNSQLKLDGKGGL